MCILLTLGRHTCNVSVIFFSVCYVNTYIHTTFGLTQNINDYHWIPTMPWYYPALKWNLFTLMYPKEKPDHMFRGMLWRTEGKPLVLIFGLGRRSSSHDLTVNTQTQADLYATVQLEKLSCISYVIIPEWLFSRGGWRTAGCCNQFLTEIWECSSKWGFGCLVTCRPPIWGSFNADISRISMKYTLGSY